MAIKQKTLYSEEQSLRTRREWPDELDHVEPFNPETKNDQKEAAFGQFQRGDSAVTARTAVASITQAPTVQ